MTGYDILTYTFTQDFNCTAQDQLPRGIFFKPDGMKMFMAGQQNTRVYEYNLSGAFDISTAVFSQSIVVPSPVDIFFKEDGLKMYVLQNTEVLHEYNLSTPWDVSTAVFFQNFFINRDSAMKSFFINETGTIMYTCGNGSSTYGTSDQLYKYTFGTPWDVSTIILPNAFGGSGHFHTIENIPSGIWQAPTQNKIIYAGQQENTQNNNRNIYTRTQTPANAMGSGMGARIDLNINAHAGAFFAFDLGPRSLFFSNFGQNFFYVRRTGQFTSAITQFSTAVDGLQKTFDINAVLTKDFENVFVGAKVVERKIVEPTIGARLVLFCDNIDTDSGWITTNGGTELLVDNASFPNVIHFESLAGGGGVTERWTSKDIQLSLSGDVKFEFKFDFQAMKPSGTRNSSEFRIFLQEDNIHPDNSTGSRIGCILEETTQDSHHLYGEVTDGVSTVASIQGGNHNQRTTHVYPPNFAGGVESSVLGPYWITVELKDSKFRMSLFLDESKTIHARGSPREVDATGINPTNLQHLVISNSEGASATLSLLTGDIDNICININEPLPPLAQNPTVATLVEDWENSAEFDQNPEDWLSATDLPSLLNPPFNVSTAIFNQAFEDTFGLLTNVGGMFIRKDTGQALYVINPSTRQINEFFLPTPFSLTGMVFNDQGSVFVGSGGTELPTGIYWKDNGFRVYTIDPNLSLSGTDDNMKEFFPQSGNAFDLSTGFGLVKEENTRDELNEGRTVGISLNPLGTRLYIVSQTITAQDITNGWTNSIHQFNMDAQPFNIGNRGLVVGSLAIGNGMTRPSEMWMSDDGLKLIVIGTNQVNEYDLGTAFEINTAVFASSRTVSPASNAKGISMKPDGRKMFISESFNPTVEQVFEFDIPTIFPPTIDVREVSTEQPNGGIKSFKLHTKFTGDGGSTLMASSVIGKRVATLPNPDGGDLLVPYKFTAKARSEIMSSLGSDRARGGVYIRYEIIQGAPFDNVFPNDGLAIIMFRSPVTPASLTVDAFDDIESKFTFINHNTGIPLETDEPEGSYFTAKANMKDIFNVDSIFNNRGLDFESHVKSISIGFWVYTSTATFSTNDVESLMYGDEINLLPATSETFDIGAVLDASMIKEKEFFINKHIQAIDQEKEFLVDAFVQALGDNGNNGGTNPFVIQPIGDGFITVPIGTLVGQRITLPSAPVRIRQFTFVARRGGLTGAPVGTLVGKVRTNSTPNGRIGIGDEIVTSINVINVADLTTDPAGEVITFDFDPEDPEITEAEDIFIGFDVEGANDEILIETNSDPDTILGGDIVTEEVCAVATTLRSNRAGGSINKLSEGNWEIFPLNLASSSALPLGEEITHIRVTRGSTGVGGSSRFRLAIYSGPGNGFTNGGPGDATPLNNQLRATTAEVSFTGLGVGIGQTVDIPLQGSYIIDSTVHNDIQVCRGVFNIVGVEVDPTIHFRAQGNDSLRKRISFTTNAYPNFPDNWLDNASDLDNEAFHFQLIGPNVTPAGATCFTDDSGEDAVITVTIDDERRQRCPVFMNAILTQGLKEKEFFMGAKVVIRTAVNCFCPNALLQAQDQEEEFFINAILTQVGVNAQLPRVNAILQAFDQEKEFFINAILQPTVVTDTELFDINAILFIVGVNQVEFFIDANVGVDIVNDETFTISAVVGLSEPESILTVESVIGHKTGLQS